MVRAEACDTKIREKNLISFRGGDLPVLCIYKFHSSSRRLISIKQAAEERFLKLYSSGLNLLFQSHTLE